VLIDQRQEEEGVFELEEEAMGQGLLND